MVRWICPGAGSGSRVADGVAGTLATFAASPASPTTTSSPFDQQFVVLLELRGRRRAPLLGELPAKRHNQVLHRHAALVALRSEKCRIQSDVANVAAGQGKLGCQKGEVDVIGDRRSACQHQSPQSLTVLLVRQREIDYEIQAAREGAVDVPAQIAGQKYDA